MKLFAWLLAVGALAGIAYWLSRWQRRWVERKRASEERLSSFMAEARASAAPMRTTQPAPDVSALANQKLLLEAASKAGEAGEPVLSIQLYARLLSRYPETTYAGQARAAVEAQKKKLPKS